LLGPRREKAHHTTVMRYQIGKAYRTEGGLLVKMQGMSRGVVLQSNDKVKHFVEMSFRVLGELNQFHIKVPFAEIVPHESAAEKEAVSKVIEAIVQGTPVKPIAPHAPTTSPEAP